MVKRVKKPRIDIERLREIAWSIWDPIPNGDATSDWKQVEWPDEYDRYMLKAFEYLWNTGDERRAVDYLYGIETSAMSLSERPGREDRVSDTVKALNAYADELQSTHSH